MDTATAANVSTATNVRTSTGVVHAGYQMALNGSLGKMCGQAHFRTRFVKTTLPVTCEKCLASKRG